MDNIICKLIPQILVVGDGMVGKTSLIRKYVDNKFSSSYIETIGSDLTFKDEYISVRTENGEGTVHVRLRIYDIGGQKQFQQNMLRYVKKSQTMVICYDITNPSSYQNCVDWYEKIQSQIDINPFNHCLILVGTKYDLAVDHDLQKNVQDGLDKDWIDGQRVKHDQVSKRNMDIMAEKLNCVFGLETSAKSGHNISDLFRKIGEISLNLYIKNEINYFKLDGILNADLIPEFIKKFGFYPDLIPIQIPE